MSKCNKENIYDDNNDYISTNCNKIHNLTLHQMENSLNVVVKMRKDNNYNNANKKQQYYLEGGVS